MKLSAVGGTTDDDYNIVHSIGIVVVTFSFISFFAVGCLILGFSCRKMEVKFREAELLIICLQLFAWIPLTLLFRWVVFVKLVEDHLQWQI